MGIRGYSTVRDPAAIAEWREFHDLTIDGLTEAVNKALRKAKSPERVKRGKIGHLCSGHQLTTSPAKAKAIEQALNQPIGKLFVHSVACSTRRNDDAA